MKREAGKPAAQLDRFAAALIPVIMLSALLVRAMSGDTIADLVLGQSDFSQ